MQNCPCCNTAVFYQLSGHNFEDYIKTGCKDMYELLFAVNSYYIINPPGPEDVIIGVSIPFTNTSSTNVPESLGHTINVTNNLFQCFSEIMDI